MPTYTQKSNIVLKFMAEDNDITQKCPDTTK